MTAETAGSSTASRAPANSGPARLDEDITRCCRMMFYRLSPRNSSEFLVHSLLIWPQVPRDPSHLKDSTPPRRYQERLTVGRPSEPRGEVNESQASSAAGPIAPVKLARNDTFPLTVAPRHGAPDPGEEREVRRDRDEDLLGDTGRDARSLRGASRRARSSRRNGSFKPLTRISLRTSNAFSRTSAGWWNGTVRIFAASWRRSRRGTRMRPGCWRRITSNNSIGKWKRGAVGRQPFGGFKMSGVGSKAGGPDYLRQFLDARVVTENTMRRGFVPFEELRGRGGCGEE